MNERLIESLKSKKMRVTEARKVIYQVLSQSDKALSVQNVFSEIQSASDIKTDKVSVYRNLSLFSELGLVHRFQDGKYSLCTHNHSDEHHKHLHVVANCQTCGSTFEVDSHDKGICNVVNKLKALIDSFGNFDDVTFQGQCIKCSS